MSELIRWQDKDLTEYYDADEVDAVIAELKDKALQYKVLYKEMCRDINSQEQHLAKQLYLVKHRSYWLLPDVRTKTDGDEI